MNNATRTFAGACRMAPESTRSELKANTELHLARIEGDVGPPELARRQVANDVVEVDAVGDIEGLYQPFDRRAADAELLRGTRIECPIGETAARISWEIPRLRTGIEEVRAVEHVGRVHLGAGCEVRPIVHDAVPVVVAARRYVERHARSGGEDTTELDVPRNRPISCDHSTVPLIVIPVAVRIVLVQIVLLIDGVLGLSGRLVAGERVSGLDEAARPELPLHVDKHPVVIAVSGRLELLNEPMWRHRQRGRLG